MFKKFKTTLASAAAFALSATPVLAITDPLGSNICQVIDKVTGFVFGLAGVIAILFILIGGIQYTTSGGDKAAVEAARGRITAAVIGLVIVLAAWLITNTVLAALGATIPACKATP